MFFCCRLIRNKSGAPGVIQQEKFIQMTREEFTLTHIRESQYTHLLQQGNKEGI